MNLRCKKDLRYSEGITPIFMKDKMYEIRYTKIENGAFLYSMLGERNITSFFSKEKHKAWRYTINEYFYSEAELRQLKLKKI